MGTPREILDASNTCIGITRSSTQDGKITVYKNGVNMELTEDTIRKSIETFLGNTRHSLEVAWNLGIPQGIQICAYENLLRPRTRKCQKEALKVIKQVANNLELKGTYHGG